MKFVKHLYLTFALLLFLTIKANAWGFYAHQRINRLAVFSLPPEMIGFYKHNIVWITEHAIDPDARRYAVEGEAQRHFIDLDIYGTDAYNVVPHKWEDAIAKYTEDTLQAYGIVPWHITYMKHRLTNAFKSRDVKQILRLSADIGHYIGDANVPLHTTENYNGHKTNQSGIHGFWESRIPELLADGWDFYVGQASYIQNPNAKAWDAVTTSHIALDSVFSFEKILTERFSEDRKYSFEERNGITTKVYSKDFSKAYDKMLGGQIERRMRNTIKMVADFWYTCWVDAGQPDLEKLIDMTAKEMEEEKEKWKNRKYKARDHEAFLNIGNDNVCCCKLMAQNTHFNSTETIKNRIRQSWIADE
jgi:hypothetical protein